MPTPAFEGRVSTTAVSPCQACLRYPYTLYWVAKARNTQVLLTHL